MSKFKGTPGPWQWVELEFCGKYHVLQDQFGVVICDDGSASGEYSPEIDVNGANARLIAAAPELLDALVELADWYREHTGLPPTAANAAIANALGEDAP